MAKAFDKIRAGLEDAIALAEGKKTGAVVHTFSAMDVKAIRLKTGLTQDKFSRALHIPIGTLRNWEQGHRRPEGPAVALLKIVDADPAHAIEMLNR
jgi:putative transcriptional regulator